MSKRHAVALRDQLRNQVQNAVYLWSDSKDGDFLPPSRNFSKDVGAGKIPFHVLTRSADTAFGLCTLEGPADEVALEMSRKNAGPVRSRLMACRPDSGQHLTKLFRGTGNRGRAKG